MMDEKDKKVLTVAVLHAKAAKSYLKDGADYTAKTKGCHELNLMTLSGCNTNHLPPAVHAAYNALRAINRTASSCDPAKLRAGIERFLESVRMKG